MEQGNGRNHHQPCGKGASRIQAVTGWPVPLAGRGARSWRWARGGSGWELPSIRSGRLAEWQRKTLRVEQSSGPPFVREIIAIAMSDRGCPPNLLLAPSDGPLLPGWSNAQIEEVCDLAEDVRNYCAQCVRHRLLLSRLLRSVGREQQEEIRRVPYSYAGTRGGDSVTDRREGSGVSAGAA